MSLDYMYVKKIRLLIRSGKNLKRSIDAVFNNVSYLQEWGFRSGPNFYYIYPVLENLLTTTLNLWRCSLPSVINFSSILFNLDSNFFIICSRIIYSRKHLIIFWSITLSNIVTHSTPESTIRIVYKVSYSTYWSKTFSQKKKKNLEKKKFGLWKKILVQKMGKFPKNGKTLEKMAIFIFYFAHILKSIVHFDLLPAPLVG